MDFALESALIKANSPQNALRALEKLLGEYDLCLNLIYNLNGVDPFTVQPACVNN